MNEPPPLPGSRDSGTPTPPPLPTSETAEPSWLDALYEMGFTDDTDVAIKAGLNLIAEIDGVTVRLHASRRSRTRYAGEDLSYRVYHGHRIELTAKTGVGTRLAISFPQSGVERWAAKSNRWFGTTHLPGVLPPFTVWASEPEWAGPFLQKEETVGELNTLLPANDLPPNIGLKWWPGFLTYSQRLNIKKVNAEKMTAWVNSLVRLTKIAEANPPRTRVELNRWERWSLEKPMQAGCLLVGAFLAFFMLLAFLVVGALLAISYAMSR